MVVLLPYNQITAASFSMPFYHTSIKRDPCLFTLPLIYITSVKTQLPNKVIVKGKVLGMSAYL